MDVKKGWPIRFGNAGVIKVLDDIQPLNADTVVLRAIAFDEKDGKSFSYLDSRCVNNKESEIVANIDRIMERLYSLQKVLHLDMLKLRVSVPYNRFEYALVVLIVSPHSVLKINDK